MDADTAPARSAAGVIVASAALTGLALGGAYWLAENFIRDELAGALGVPCAVANVLAIASLVALQDRGSRMAPLQMIGGWALVVPVFAAITTALVSLSTERLEYVPHATLQSAVRAEIAVASAALVLGWAWLRRRLRRAR